MAGTALSSSGRAGAPGIPEPQSHRTLLSAQGGSYLIDQDPGHVLMGRLQGLGELGVGVHELRAALPGGTLHDAVC